MKEFNLKAVALNRIAQAGHVQILKQDNLLITEGYLKIVQPANAAQSYFINKGQVIVQITKKGSDFVFLNLFSEKAV